jgi:hypothetical protein
MKAPAMQSAANFFYRSCGNASRQVSSKAAIKYNTDGEAAGLGRSIGDALHS